MSTVAIPQSLASLVEFLNRLDRRVPLESLREHLSQLDISLDDLSAFLHFGDTCYSRNLICESTWYELLCICWKSGQQSLIHNHANSTCGLRVITGQGVEITFSERPDGKVEPVGTCRVRAGDICCTQDADIHQVANLHPQDNLVTLHIYSPPLRQMRTWECADNPTRDPS